MSPKDALTAEEQKNNLDLNQDKIIKNSNLNKQKRRRVGVFFVCYNTYLPYINNF